jgi:hypothetical protein
VIASASAAATGALRLSLGWSPAPSYSRLIEPDEAARCYGFRVDADTVLRVVVLDVGHRPLNHPATLANDVGRLLGSDEPASRYIARTDDLVGDGRVEGVSALGAVYPPLIQTSNRVPQCYLFPAHALGKGLHCTQSWQIDARRRRGPAVCPG